MLYICIPHTKSQQEPVSLVQSVSGNLTQLTGVVCRGPGDRGGLEGQGRLRRKQERVSASRGVTDRG